MALTDVGVEKVAFGENSRRFGNRKCPPQSTQSLVGHLGAMKFLSVFQRMSFSTATDQVTHSPGRIGYASGKLPYNRLSGKVKPNCLRSRLFGNFELLAAPKQSCR
jgi:hypothetical protein